MVFNERILSPESQPCQRPVQSNNGSPSPQVAYRDRSTRAWLLLLTIGHLGREKVSLLALQSAPPSPVWIIPAARQVSKGNSLTPEAEALCFPSSLQGSPAAAAVTSHKGSLMKNMVVSNGERGSRKALATALLPLPLPCQVPQVY